MLAVVIVISRGHHGPVPLWASVALWAILALTAGLLAWLAVEAWRGRL